MNFSNDREAWEMLSLRNIRHVEALPDHVRPHVLINDYWKLVRNSTEVNQRHKSSATTLWVSSICKFYLDIISDFTLISFSLHWKYAANRQIIRSSAALKHLQDSITFCTFDKNKLFLYCSVLSKCLFRSSKFSFAHLLLNVF